MRNLSENDVGYFVFNLALTAGGLGIALVHVAGLGSVDLETALVFTVAFGLIDAMSVRLSRGDTVFFDGAIALASAILLDPPVAVMTCLLGVVLAATFDTRNRKPLVVRLSEILRRPLLVAGLAYLSRTGLNVGGFVNGETLALISALVLGLVHTAVDFGLLVVGVSLEKHQSVISSATGLLRSLSALYAAHVSLGVATVLLFPSGRLWGLGVMVALVLLIQYSFNLLLKTKGAYGETIQALVRASELQSGASEEGHAQRVADMSVHAGRLLGFSSKSLERLNYAALLHEIGRIGLDEGEEPSDVMASHPQRGADIVAGIPFLASAQAVIRNQSAQPVAESLRLDDQDALSAQLVGVCCVLDRFVVSNPGRCWSGESLAEGLDGCAPHVDARVRGAVLNASARWLRLQKARSRS